jgi:GntR family transcriptional regulator
MLVTDPVYLQLTQALRAFIERERMPEGSRFLTEREISARFGVSRVTANKALSSLVSQGALRFRKGIGTFVGSQPLQYDLRALVSFTDKARAADATPSTRVLKLARLAAAEVPPPIATALGVASEAELYEIRRVRLADGKPVILEHRYVVAAHCPDLQVGDAIGSLYAFWTQRCRLAIAGADETIRAVRLTADEAALLKVDIDSAALEVAAIGRLAGDQPLWWERTLYRGDAYELHNQLGPIERARPAAGVLRSFNGADSDQ